MEELTDQKQNQKNREIKNSPSTDGNYLEKDIENNCLRAEIYQNKDTGNQLVEKNKQAAVNPQREKEEHPYAAKADLPVMRGELALLMAVLINSFGVVLMLHSGAGISAISSVPYAFSVVLTKVSLGTWTYIFQGILILILSLMILRKKFVPQYLFSFVVGFAFSELLDVHELWIDRLPLNIPFRVLYFVISYLLLCIGIALSNRCKLPIIPTDLFPRELADITGIKYSRIKISFDVICLAITAAMTLIFLGHLKGLGIGTVLAAFTMGKVIGLIGEWMDRRMTFVSILEKHA